MYTSLTSLSKSFSTIQKFILTVILFVTVSINAYSHGTQVAYCITNQGKIRVYIEHWHGNISPGNVTSALVSIDVTDTSTGVTTNQQQIPDGVVWDTTKDNLPDCKGPLTILSSCPGRADVYNDWVYWEFTPPACFVNLNINVVEVIGSQSWYFDEACSQLYPVSFTDSFIDCVAPTIECPSNVTQNVNATGCEALIASGLEPTVLFDDCTPVSDLVTTYTVTGALTASGSGNANGLSFPKGTSTITYSVTDNTAKTSTCSFDVTVVDTSGPTMTCPSNLSIECNLSGKGILISDWLNSISATDLCGIQSITNNYDPNGFAYLENNTIPSNNPSPYGAFGSVSFSNLNHTNIIKSLFDCRETIDFNLQEMSGSDLFDYVVKIRINKKSTSVKDFSKIIFGDSEDRLMPYWIENETDAFADIWIKIPEAKANEKSAFKLMHGECQAVQFSYDDVFSDELTPETASLAQAKPIIIGTGISNLSFLNDAVKNDTTGEVESKMMTCDCTATQGSQSFNISAIQNAEDDVSFYQYGTPNGASANTGLEMNDAVVLFLYENTLTGEVSLFILIDDAGGGNGGRGSIDFFCLPAGATLDFSDDPGEISGIFPSVTANWRWANCCTDGALIGNVGCNTTFDFYPDFISGINTIKWASGTLAAPVFTNFGNISDPVRIQCGMGQPDCCPNENTVTVANATCPSSSDGSIDLIVDASGGPYTYSWSNGATTEDINNISPGVYTVTVIDDNDCEQVIPVTVNASEKPELVCTADQIVTTDQTSVTLVPGVNVMYSVNYSCTDNVTVSCVGCGTFACDDQNTTVPITLRVTDVLGNVDECSINVTISNPGPDLDCPDDLEIECNLSDKGALITSWLDEVSSSSTDLDNITNNYDPVGFSFFDGTPDADYLAYHSSGKQASYIQTKPKDYYFDFSFLTTAVGDDSATGSQIVTFTATDNCGNTSTCTATITIVDTTDPVITCPSDITIECGDPNSDAIITNWLDNATANDACDLGVVVTNNFVDGNFTGGCDGPNGTRTVRFTATDCDGNTSTCDATITREDTTPPEFLIQPTDLTVGCINSAGNTPELNAWLAANGGGIASDQCDPSVTWSRVEGPTVDLCGYTFSRDYTFTITDNCGNSATAVATYTVEDTTPPVINLAWETLTQTCNANNETNLASYLETNKRATDVCSPDAEVTIDWEVMSDQESCGGTIHRTYLYTATDACGNTSTDIFEYITTDVAVPTWASVPGTLILECGDPDNATIITQWIEDVENSMFDACGGGITITNNWDGSLTEGCNQNTVVVWTVTDDCGNTRTLSRTIAVRDTTNPSFVACPDDFTVNVDVDECGSNVTFPTPVGFDQCTPQDELEIIQINGPASGSSFPVGTTYVRFRLRDGCNRQDLCDFFITVVDSDEPDISCPSNVEACAGANLCYWRSDASVLPITNENCASLTVEVEITGATVLSRRNGNASNRNFNVGTSNVCYYLTDGAGNETECCFDVIVSDCQDPVINCPADITNAACGSTPPAAFMASATDNCSAAGDIVITSMLYNTISGCGETETQVYQFTATDEAGNTSQCFANFTTIDNVLPVITTPASAGASDCASADIDLLAWLNDNGGAEANDACGTVAWSYEFVGGAATGCSGAPSVNVTFTATDECGNTATTAAAFNVDDTTAPTISCPSDITLECGDVLNDSVIELWLGLASGEDNCSEVTITNDFPADPMLDCDGTITVTFTAEDACGNDAECEATITMEDVTAPSFTILPQDLTLECGDPGNAAAIAAHTSSIGNAVFSDQCTDNADMTIDVDDTGDDPQCGNATILEYQVTLTDECDNNTEAAWFIHIEDTTPPVLTVPANINFNCDGSGNVSDISLWLSGATATDMCGTATVESVLFNSSDACGNFENQSYLFTATDECGNVSTDIATVTITDTQGPVITCPADLTLSCGANNNSALVIAWLDSVAATDVCSDVTLTNNYTGLFPANCGGTLSVTFLATDACGNTSTCMADIIMEDVITPDFENCPEDLTINVDVSNCGSNPIFSTPTAIDNCGVTVAQTTGPASGTPFPVGTTTVGFTATDECGNTTTCEFDITVVDSADPLVLCPQNLYDRCITDGTCVLEINDIEPILGMENCPGFTITYDITGATTASGTDDASGTEFNMGVSEICYTLTDASSNSSTCCFEVQVLDCTPPTVTCPDDLTVTCDGSGNTSDLVDWLAEASATDACSTPVTFESQVYNTISGCGETYSVVYEFTGTDAAGNTSICYAQFTIEDITDPVIDTEAEDLTVECDGANNSNDIQSWLNSFGGAEASDGCGEITFSHDFSGNLSDLCAETGSITVIFTATDDCGNTATTDAVFTIEDTTAPTISCPVSITLECGDPLNDAIIANWLATASATDVCSDVSFTNDFATSFVGTCGDAGTYTVTFTATDDCGNNTTCEGVILVEDNSAPAFDQAPVDITIECADPNYTALYNTWIASNGEGVASDACGDVTWSHVVLDLIPSCGDAGTLPHVWTITDECGTTSTAVANVITVDNAIPEITAPAALTVECDGTGNQTTLEDWLEDVTVSDDCGDVTTSYILNNTISACGGGSEANYLFTVTDACGNTATATSSFTIEDTTVPEITCPGDLSLECGAIGNDQSINAWLISATATDGCSTVSVTNDYDGTFPADCNGSVTVVFTATDECGNTATCEADILMDDTTDPVFVNCPDDLTINVDVDACGSNPIFSTPIADDNCTVTVTQTDGLSSGSTFPVGVTAIEFTATDACGNTAVCQFNITVIDSDVPQIFCPSTTVTQCTDIGFCTWTSDNAVAPSTSFENCDDYTIDYTITGATMATGSDSAAGEVFNVGLSTVCYTITDASDNESTCCFDVLITDCEAPQLVCPNDLIVECAATNETQKSTWLNSAVSADNCDLAATITFELFNSISDCGGAYSEQYLITATDAAGNASSCIRTFTVEDNTAPVINTAIPDVTVECDGNNNIDALIAWLASNGNIDDSDVSEYCSDFSWNNNFDQVVFTSNTPCSDDIGYYEVMFWVVDDCGNESNRITKQFIIEDTTDPTLVVPDNLTLQCDNPLNEAIISSWLLDVSASDLCDSDVSITNESNVVDQCGNTSTTTYTFTATDACGNTTQANATVVIEDNEAPTIITPASDLMLECADADNADAIEDWEDSFGGAAAADNCSDEDLDWDILSEVSTAGCGDVETVTYVFVVEDNCGNTSTTTAQLIITDTTDPELTLPENQIEECGAIVVNTTDWINEATATDDCGDVTIDATLINTISDCGGTFTEVYLFTATDACGNTSTGLANYELDDSTVPEITCPEDLILECGDEENDTNIQAWLNAAISVDANNCSATQITHDYTGGYPDPFICDSGAGILVTFTSTDDCGNISTCTASILMDDTEDPYFVNCPSNLIVNVDTDLCATNVIYSTPVALDNCDEMVSVVRTAGLPSGVEFPLGPTQITFEATDDCGNVSTCTFQITVVDSDTPSIDCPSNDVEKCTDVGNCTWLSDDDVDPLFNDNCSDLTLTYTITGATSATSDLTGVNKVSEDGIVFEIGTSEICYTVTDGTGNTGSCCFDVIISDCESPAIFCSNDTDVACGAENVSAWFDGIAATATDNCNTNADLTVDTLLINDISSCGNTFDKTYLFTVTDEAGNTSTCIATYETDDTVPPTIDTEAQDLTIECTGGNQSIELQAWLNTNAGAVASDVCSGPVTWTNDFTSGLTPTCGDIGSILVTFTATDDCGNTSTTDATFTIEDTTVPVLTLPENITLECGDSFNDELVAGWLAEASAEDICDGTLTVINDYDTAVASDLCGLTGVTTVTFTTTDACDNVTTDTRTITIEDTTSPVIQVSASDLVLECAGGGNEAAIEAWEMSSGGASATDTCSDEDLVWTILSETETVGCGSNVTTVYVFQVEDNCGNTSTTSASVSTEDNIAPELTLPEDQLEECGNVVVTLEEWRAEVTATDDCGDVEITSVLWNTISGCGNTDAQEYLFTATDACGNETTGIATYEIEDTSTPTITCPEDLILECGNLNNDQMINVWLESATATDEYGCNDIEISYVYPGMLPTVDCSGAAGITVTFTATDACGNTDECMAMIIMNDTTIPVFQTCPDDMTVNVDVGVCANNVVYSTPTAFDNCDDDLMITQTAGPASGTEFPLGTSTITFEVEDNCGNTSECSFDITVVDTDTPSIDCPSNDVVVCNDEGTCTWISDDKTNPIFNDNCPGLVVTYEVTGMTSATSPATGVNIVAEDGIIFNLGTSEVCYTITDPTGNTTSCCFNVVVEDCESPTITCSDQLDIACGSEDISFWFNTIAATITDNCSTAGGMQVDTLLLTDFSSCGGTFEKVYLYTVTDEAGNTATCTATYETDDEVSPSIDVEAANLTLECNDGNQSTALQAWLNSNGGAMASDICSGPVSWTNDFINDLDATCGTNGTIDVIFTATDDCGNTSTTSATFTIEDTTSPALALPADITLECADAINATVIENWLNSASAEDACEGTLTVVNDYATAVQTDECGLTGVTTVTFTVTDACDNSTTDTRTITIEDNTDPVITVEPTNLELECAGATNDADIAAWETNFGGADASDTCSDEDLAWTIISETPFGNCGDSGSTLYVFQVTDNCGNTATTSASVIISDNTDPVLTVPADIVVECNNPATSVTEWLATATATDDCGDVTITHYLNNTISGCGSTNTEVYIFTATDACGNQMTGTANYELEDTTDPVIVCPNDLILNCGNPSNDLIILEWLNSATASDPNDCSDVTITYTDPSSLPAIDCSGGGGAVIIWTATDDCGNTSTCEAMIIVEDAEPPTFVNCPTDLTINVDVDACSSNPIFSTPVADDNCSVTVMQVANANGDLLASGTAFPIGVTEVVFIATDICGNTAECSFEITVEDTDVPIVLCPSNTIEVSTDPGVCTWTSDDQVATAFSVENCPDQTLVYEITGATTASGNDNAAGDVFELGLSTVCYTLTDASGNESMCCFDVLVVDQEMPMMTCPDDVTINTSAVIPGDCMSDHDWTHPTIADNCSIVNATLELAMQSPTGVLSGPTLVTAGAASTSTFELGTTTLTYVLTDENGNVTTCEWTVMVEDDEVPMITCPVDMTFEINDDCQYTETGDVLDPVVSDNCQLDLLAHDYIFAPSANTLSGASFEIGTTTVRYVVYDESGNSSSCAFDITVEDNEAPEFVNCPQDTLVVGNDVDQCSAFVNWSDPIAMDECGVAVAQTAGPNSGDELAPGFYTVTYVATDNNGNTSICEFVIHVQDTQMPIVLCPSNDVVVETDLGVCTWTSPAESLTATTALTNCPFDLTWTVTNPDGSTAEGDEDVSGYVFALGTSQVCYDVIEQEDPDGNGFMSDQCCFNVIVEDNEKPLVICQDDVVINTSAGGMGDCLANYEWNHPAPTDNCGIAMIFVTVTDADGTITGPLDVVAGDNMIYDFPLGISTIVYDIEDENGNASSCQFTVTVEDDEVPMIECVEDVVESVDENCQYVVVDSSLDPAFSDNCNIDLSYHDYIFAPNSSTLAGAKFEFGVTEIVWTVVDDFGNSSTCTHTVTTEDTSAPMITNCPANPIVQDSDSGSCDAIVNFSNMVAEDNCGGLVTIEFMLAGEVMQGWTEGQASGITYPVGTTRVSYRATDQYGNVSEVCEFDIEVVDNMDPVAVCQDIEIGVDFNCMATITPEDINAGSSDNCEIASLLISSDGVTFEEELTFMTEDLTDPFVVVTLQVTDEYGNISICQSTVFIVDEIDPMVICQDDIIVPTEPGVCYALVPNVVPPIDTTDNCMGIANVRQEPLPGLLFGSEVGDSMFVTVIVEDEAGNMDSCQVKLVIEDTEIPQFTNCPRPPVVVAAETDLCSAAANFSVPTGTDNCGDVEITRIDDIDLDSGDWFPIGTTILEYQIEDGSGNKDTCHIKVIVNDLQPPTLECPSDVVQVNDPGECGAIVKDIDPQNVTDNCTDEVTVTFAVDWEGTRDNGGVIEASGEFFQVGNNVVTYCVEDRPTIVISEVTHAIGAAVGTNAYPSFIPNGDDEDYIEITNVGPSSVDVSCLVVEKLSGSTGGVGSLTLPFGTVIPTGGVMVIHVGPGTDSPLDLYYNMDVGGSNPGDAAGYALMYGECILDVVALNGFTASGSGSLLTIQPSDWIGVIDSDAGTAGVYRPFTFDGNNNLDWAVVSDDNPGSIGLVNTDFDVYPETGLTSSLQSKCGTKLCCTFTVEIFDTEPPTIECPDDMVLNTSDNGTGDCTSSTSWKHPDIDDNCGTTTYCMTITYPDGMEEENCTITPGDTFISTFEVGETILFYEVEDTAGNRSTCSFTITVLDDEDPTFTCPDDLFIQLGQGQCFVNIFNQINLFEADNCGDMTMVSNPDMDGQFNEGENVVNIVITDAAGNERACSFMITVAAYVPTDTEMACQGTVNISLDADCEAVITADMILTSMDIGCIDDIQVSISETHGGPEIPTSPMVNSDYLNQTLIVTLFNPDTGNSCWGTILIEDKLNPIVECPMDITVSCATDLEPASLGAPELLSCEEATTMIFTDEVVDNGVCGIPRAIHTRTWIVTDESGNSTTCEHTITVERLNTVDITFPENYDDIDNPSFDCNAVASDPLLIHPMNTGQPMIDGLAVVESSYCPLSINMEDEVFHICSGSYDILRTFRVYDPCLPVEKVGPNPNPFHYIQVIKVRDNTVPDVVCPANLVVSVDDSSCSADINFPAIDINEACGSVDVQLITPFGSLNTNGGVINNIAIGTFSARYVVTDGCGNQTECSIAVEVLDAIEPIMVCNPDVVVSLNSNGVAEVYAEAFDQGTTDNCTLDRLEVRRMTTACGIDTDLEFGMSITFCCADVGVPVMVQLRAYDKVGNFNECMVEVIIDDKEEAVITCPADITIDCGDDFMDLSLTGAATFTDNCTGDLMTADFVDDSFIDQCGNGYVIRTWSIGTVSCMQRIDLVDPQPFVITDTTCDNADTDDGVIWPCDVEVESCEVMQDPSIAGEPVLFDDNCTMVAVDYTDQVFTFVDNACFKIVRTWEVIDWCTFDGSTGEGRYTYDQVIKIINSMDPEFTSCEAVDVCTSNDSCEATVTATVSGADDCTEASDLQYTYQLDISNDGSFNLSGSGNTVTQTLEIGTHSVLWTITDGCGNVNNCTQLINVNDCKAPTVACINGLSTSLDSGTGSIEIWAVDFNASSTDNCTATEDLVYSFSTDVNDTFVTFTCADLPNGIEQEIQVQMWVTDAYGNQSFCTTTILVQDVHDDCIDVMLTEAEIAGRIMTENQIGVNQVEINVENMETGVPYDEMSDTLGHYTFPDPMPAQFEYTIKPEKDVDHKNGITALDLITIKKHLLQVDTLDSPYKLIAADINNSESVTAIDLIQLQKLLLGVFEEFPSNMSWRFVNQDFEFPIPTDPWPFEESRNIDPLMTNQMHEDFIAVKIGDVNGSADPSNATKKVTERSVVTLFTDDILLVENKTVEIPLYANEKLDLSALQFTLKANDQLLEVVEIKSDILTMDVNDQASITDQLTTMLWYDHNGILYNGKDAILTLVVKPKANVLLSDALELNSNITAAALFTTSEVEYDLKLDIIENQDDFTVAQNVPNPFKEETTIMITVPQPGSVVISVYNVLGEKLIEHKEDIAKSFMHTIQSDQLGGVAGMYLYEVSYQNEVIQKNVILIN